MRRLMLISLLIALAAMMTPEGARAQPADPCSLGQKSNAAISESASAVIIPGQAGRRAFLCFVFLGTAGAQNLSIVEGTGTVCATNQLIIMGGPGATGPASQANGTFTLGNGGATIGFGTVIGNDICLLQSAAGLVAGNMIYVRQ
jgi:hypothetical protein